MGDLGDPGVLGVRGQRPTGSWGVGGVSGLFVVGDGGLDREDLREPPDNKRERLLFIFNDLCGVTACIAGAVVDP